ncbi:hypothetical protein SAMD00019534_052920 [Acytostelium subglobosum LB1]|uniref:hypothetical protein n=1 Tax=Acytostelium subglobosum LB1 TaxID=1410327 RepID=UPI0006450BD8|nr:hypothetical protein SAMD00019534_052920 [Acytostelium subglobosum LB1]GAM22117.1 hypothetical protein SAMD00019534_052920 [Acytostelium subglobosum LB1]|eukprot:XP_012755217.1 hypothetical protein SAMD00019534_052920 [Acytostelium subglobosum LB1]
MLNDRLFIYANTGDQTNHYLHAYLGKTSLNMSRYQRLAVAAHSRFLEHRHLVDSDTDDCPSTPNSRLLWVVYRCKAGMRIRPSRYFKQVPITHLRFAKSFNHPLADRLIPSSVCVLTFGKYFNQPVPRLPQGLTSLTFGRDFNCELTPGLLPSIKTLVFGMSFNKALRHGSLPDSVTRLKFGEAYNNGEKSNSRSMDCLPPGVIPSAWRQLPTPLPAGLIPGSVRR